MKTKHLGVVTVCALALTMGTANATTYTVNTGTYPNHSAGCPSFPPPPPLCDQEANFINSQTFSFGPLTGTLDINDGAVTGVNINPFHAGHLSSFTSPDVWTVVMLTGGAPGAELQLTDYYGVASSVYFYLADYPDPDVTYSGAVGTITTPLPATLSLSATGLAGLGLLGWRRKKTA
jgi:hypothetical protein